MPVLKKILYREEWKLSLRALLVNQRVFFSIFFTSFEPGELDLCKENDSKQLIYDKDN